MITLLLGLFIVLFAMSSIDAKQFDNVKRSLAQTFNGEVLEEPGSVLPGSNGVQDPTAASDTPTTTVEEIENASRTTAARFDKEQSKLRDVAKELRLANDVQVVRTERGIAIRLAGDALFEPGSYAIRPEMREGLVTIERELAAFGHPIEIGGHTDGQPFDGEFGNMGLSTSRANAVHKLFLELKYPVDKMTTKGFAAIMPVVQPKYPKESVRANRRIEITILEPGSGDGFPNDAAKNAATREAKASLNAAQPSVAEVDKALDESFDDGLVDELAITSAEIG